MCKKIRNENCCWKICRSENYSNNLIWSSWQFFLSCNFYLNIQTLERKTNRTWLFVASLTLSLPIIFPFKQFGKIRRWSWFSIQINWRNLKDSIFQCKINAKVISIHWNAIAQQINYDLTHELNYLVSQKMYLNKLEWCFDRGKSMEVAHVGIKSIASGVWNPNVSDDFY